MCYFLFKELRRLEEEFDDLMLRTMESAMKTPERESRETTPIPDVPEDDDDPWLDTSPPRQEVIANFFCLYHVIKNLLIFKIYHII